MAADRTDSYAASILERLARNFQAADFESAQEVIASIKEDWLPAAGRQTLLTLKLGCAVAEVLDYVGRYDHALRVIEEAGKHCRTVLLDQFMRPDKPEELSLLKQRVWVTIHWGYTFYRRHEYARAHSLFELCARVLERYVSSETNPCWWTWSRISYSRGLVHRQLYEYRNAKEEFTKCIDFAWRALQQHPTGQALTHYTVAKALALGLGWIYYNEGLLHIARPLILAARLLLSDTKAHIIKAYVNVVYGSVQRSAFADDPRGLGEAIEVLLESHEALKSHDAYRIRAEYELAIAYLQSARLGKETRQQLPQALEKAEGYIGKVKDFSEKRQDVRWLCNASIIQSRIHRDLGDHPKAEDLANRALANSRRDLFTRIDALIARGEARLGQNNYDGAYRDFRDALDKASDNPKVAAVCNLHLARASTGKRDIRLAIRHFDAWQRIQGQVDNAFIRRLGKQVGAQLDPYKENFVVEFNDQNLTPGELEQELHYWLTSWARARCESDKDAAKLLGISLPTFYKWRAKAHL
jgi:tetratricopeptide (TPR) repeat protein